MINCLLFIKYFTYIIYYYYLCAEFSITKTYYVEKIDIIFYHKNVNHKYISRNVQTIVVLT